MEIKKGDLVRSIGHGCDVTKGKKYEVTGVKTYDDGDIMAIEFYDDKYDHRIIGLSSFEKVLEFGKKDLKNGYILEDENGNIWLVLERKSGLFATEIRKFDGSTPNELGSSIINFEDALTEDLKSENNAFNPTCDIVKVYDLPDYTSNYLDVKNRELLWKREEEEVEVEELTVDEISEKLGYKIKVIGEDK
jgi:hypothetical protein